MWILTWSIVGWIGTLAAPVLAEHPFVLMMLSPRTLFAAMAVDSVNLAVFVLLGTLRLAATDASYFIVGRRYPGLGQARRERRASAFARIRRRITNVVDAMVRWLCGHGLKAGTVLFLRPNGKYMAVAGANGVSAAVAGCASVAGTMLYLSFLYLGVGVLI